MPGAPDPRITLWAAISEATAVMGMACCFNCFWALTHGETTPATFRASPLNYIALITTRFNIISANVLGFAI